MLTATTMPCAVAGIGGLSLISQRMFAGFVPLAVVGECIAWRLVCHRSKSG